MSEAGPQCVKQAAGSASPLLARHRQPTSSSTSRGPDAITDRLEGWAGTHGRGRWLWRRRYFQPNHGDGGRVLLGSHVHGHDRCGYGRTLSGSTVTFHQATDTFFPDVEFTAEQDRLTGEGDFGDESIRLVLTRSE